MENGILVEYITFQVRKLTDSLFSTLTLTRRCLYKLITILR